MQDSQVRRQKFLALSREVYNKSQIAKEAQLKAKIMQDLISGKIDLASETYQRRGSILKDTSKEEISWFVHLKVDEDVVQCLFPGLPIPMKMEQLEAAKIASVDEVIRIESEAKERLEAERKALHGLTGTAPTMQQCLQQAQQASNASSPSLGRLCQKTSSLGMTRQTAATHLATGKSNINSNPQEAKPDATTRVLQHLMNDNFDLASEVYMKNKAFFDVNEDRRKEISLFALPAIKDEDLVSCLFPGLPPQHTATSPDRKRKQKAST
mgnify:CR=1 FL=1